MRAFRPSSFGRQDTVDEEVERAKEENVRRYARLVQAGLPLFEQPSQHQVAAAAAMHLGRQS